MLYPFSPPQNFFILGLDFYLQDSILENIGDIGVELPPFLMRLVCWVKAAAEDQAELPEHGRGDGVDHG